MVDNDITIILRRDLSHKTYLKLVEFLDSGDAKDGNHNLLRIVKAEASGNPPVYRGVTIGFYRDYTRASVPKAKERSKKVVGNLIEILYKLDTF